MGKVFNILFGIFLFGLLIFLEFAIVYPAYISSEVSCMFQEVEQMNVYLQDKGMYVEGIYSYENTNVTIFVEESNEKYYKIDKHENCHLIQDQQNRSERRCSKPFSIFINEAECYTAQYLPDLIYEKIYSKI